MKNQKLTIKQQQINKAFQKVPSFSHTKLTPSIFGMNNFKKNSSSSFCIVGTGAVTHDDLPIKSYETFNEEILKNEGSYDKHGCSTQMSGLLSLNLKEMKGLCPKSDMYYAKAFNQHGEGSYNAVAASMLWGIIQGANCIILPCEIKERYDGLYSILKQAHDANISIVAPTSLHNKVKYEEILYVADGSSHIKNAINMPRRNKIYTTHTDNSYVKAHGIYYRLSATAGLLEILKSEGIKSNKNAYETMLSYFQ